jgi:2-iminobutanoate/2-iminopropanoate deaminase
MRTPVETGLPRPSVPSEHAVVSNGLLYTAQIPMKPDGTIETGSATVQTELTLNNLKKTIEAAGGTLDDVNQVLIYLSTPDVFQEMNAVYGRFFNKPYPNRATVVVGLLEPGMVIEIAAHANIGNKAKS